MSNVHLACGLPFCPNNQDQQTNFSIGLRITVIVLGVLAATIGALILLNVPGLSQLGTTAGWTLVSIGAFLTFMGASIKCVNKLSNNSGEIKPFSGNDLKQISKNTLDLVQQGYYSNSLQERIALQSGLDLHTSSKLFKYDQQDLQPVQSKYEQKVCVLEKDCLKAAQESADKGNKVAVLNFAGPEEVGGGFLDGTAGQEEKLIYRTDFAALMKYYHDEQDNAHQIDAYPLYNHLMHTPDVTVFRNRLFTALDVPFKIGILTSAAPVPKPTSAPTAFDIKVEFSGDVDYADESTKTYLKSVIFTQLKVAYDAGYETIVLGAFGCGAFRNPPQAVAKMYHEVITTYFKGAFKEIIFAILDGGRDTHNPKGNIQPFKGYFPDVSL